MPRSIRASACLLIVAVCCGSMAIAAGLQHAEGFTPARLFPEARFDPAIPTQKSIVGFDPGARPLRHDELLRYLEALAESSPRASMTAYAETHEGRRLVVFAVSDESTVADLDSFREEHRRRVDPRGRAAAEDRTRLDGAKAVAWIAYGIHGDELSSVDAAAAIAYWLVAGEDERTRTLRRDLVILIDPCENPDGRDRYLAQTASFAHRVPSPDSEDLSHTTVWPWGRGNHYLFDLNRDWFSMVQPESARSGVIGSWNPQLMVDSHEMGSHDTYLFSPPRHPFNPHLPDSHLAWWQRFGADQARALDSRGYPYYTREWNEEFFPGYGSSWAAYHGAIGILYEMSRTSGTLVRQRGGTLRTYAQAVEHQVASSAANLATLAANREPILADFVADRRTAILRAGREGVGSWVLPRGRNPERTDELAALLRRQGIEVLHADPVPELSGLRGILDGAPIENPDFPAGAWLVPLDQPAAPLVRTLLDPHVPMDAAFLREEREYLERGKGSRLYEITSWSLPLSFGIDAYWTKELSREGWSDRAVEPRRGNLERSPDRIGYVVEGRADAVMSALAGLLQSGIVVRVAEKPFTVGGREYGRGSLLIRGEGNPDDLETRLADVVERWKIDVRVVGTAKAERGPDLGGRHFRSLIAPRVGILTGYPVSPTDYGALWHLFDQQIELRFSGLDVGRFGGVDLRRYNLLVFPPTFGGSGAYANLLGESGIERLKDWIKAGGTAIGIGSGAEFLADKKHALTRTRLRRQALDRYPSAVVGIAADEAAGAGPFRATGIRAPSKKNGEDESPKKSAHRDRSPYDVAPVLGAGAVPFAAAVETSTRVESTPVALSEWLEPLLPAGQEKPESTDLERADARLRRFGPRGAFLRLELDHEVWLTWGLPRELPALVRASDTLVAEPPVQVAAQFADLDRLHLGGLLWPEAAGRLAHTAYTTREAIGRGQVILFLNTPEFRGWTRGTRRLLLNAILYGPGLGTRWSNPW